MSNYSVVGGPPSSRSINIIVQQAETPTTAVRSAIGQQGHSV
jgi:hypothetical protein